MQRDSVVRKLLAAGLDSGVAQKAVDANLNLTELRKATKKKLLQIFSAWDVDRIRDALKRAPIADEVIDELIQKCDWACCLCWDLDDRKPVIIHHLHEHAKGADDTYGNLVVLCLNHHALAHSKWEISRPPAPPDYIKSRKEEFEREVAEFKSGRRPAPGREGDASNAATQSDVDALKRIASFLDRPAVFRPFAQEGNMRDFLAELSNVNRAFGAGVLKTRAGDDLGRIKPYREFSNPHWRERLELVRNQFDTLLQRIEVAIRDGELEIGDEGQFYSFNNPELAPEIDAMRRSAASMLNLVLRQAAIPEIRGPARELRRDTSK